MQANDYFKLNTKDLSEIRYIKLDKKASYTENWNEEKGKKEEESEKYQDDSITFYSFGFYDLLTCFKASGHIDYMEHFHISQSNSECRSTLKVEQWFGLFPVSDGCVFSGEESENTDPFFCECTLLHELPFLGVILISLSNSSMEFGETMEGFVESIESKVTEENAEDNDTRFILKLYYSQNCADLCLVIRTDSLNFIHKTNHMIEEMAESNGTQINTTVIFSVQDVASESDLSAIADKNKEVSFIVRSNEKYSKKSVEADKKIESEISCEPDDFEISYGVNGTGKFVTKFNFQDYSKCLPVLIKYKLGCASGEETIPSYVRSICHEREWFQGENSVSDVPEPEHEKSKMLQRMICRWIKSVWEKIKDIDDIAHSIFLFSEGNYGYKKMFEREFRLVKDLVDTYSDLWYKNVSQSGYVFFAQIWIALIGIEEMLNRIKKLEDSAILQQSVQNLYVTIHGIACDLNGYNKQFQYLNQDSVNFPSYEIQSKVNSEKYMAAYSSFLHRFFAIYYQNKAEGEYTVQSFPLALIDIAERKIETNIFFSALYKQHTKEDNSCKRSLFSVHFPSAEYFSNVWNSIPLLMHEIFHILHYGHTKDRNQAVIYNIDNYFTEMIVSKLLNIINDGVTISNSSFVAELLREPVYHTIVKERTEFFEISVPEKYISEDYKEWRFREVMYACQEFYRKIFDCYDDAKRISYKQVSDLQNKIKRDAAYVLQSIEFTEMCCAFGRGIGETPKQLYYAANVINLYFNPDLYHTFDDKFDSFFGMLREDIYVEKNEPAGEIFSFMASVCKKFDRNNKLPEIDEIKNGIYLNDSNNWQYVIGILFAAGMASVFEKYQMKFSNEDYEGYLQNYFEAVLPKLYYDNVVDYSKNLKQVYQNSRLPKEDKRILKNMFYEYFELYRSANNLVRFLSDKELLEFRETEDDARSFIKAIHDGCREYLQGLINADESKFFEVAFAGSNREQLVKLGLIDEEDDIFDKVFGTMLSGVDGDFVKDFIADRISLFQEVYADCGMCTAMGFDFFGYCMFSLSNHNTVNDFTATDEMANFLADRIRAIAGMYFDSRNNEDLGTAKAFLSKLFDKEMIRSIIQMLSSINYSEELCELLNLLTREEFIPNFMIAASTRDVFLSVTKAFLNQWEDKIISVLLRVIEMQYQSNGEQGKENQQKVALAKTYLFNLYSVLEIFNREDIFIKIANGRDVFGN